VSHGRDRFSGRIAGVGTASGVRVVVGRWDASPLGEFADVMLAQADRLRVLLAPSEEVAEFVAATYTFDRVEIGPVGVTGERSWLVAAPGLALRLELGRRLPLGHALRVVPRRLATAPAWAALTDPVARVVLRGVRTRGTAGNGRREYYGATDLHAVDAVEGSWQGVPLGALAPVEPEPGFGFGSTPRKPSVTSLVTTVISGTA
jgi:hypothetical protein